MAPAGRRKLRQSTWTKDDEVTGMPQLTVIDSLDE